MIRRILAAALLLVVAGVLLVLAWPQLFALQRSALAAQAVSFRGFAAVIAIVVVVALTLLTLIVRRFRRLGASLALLLIVFALVNVAVASTRGFGNPSFPTKSKSEITVVSWNTLGDAPGAAQIAKLALSSHADIVTLPETSKATADAVAGLMAQAGHPMHSLTVAFDQISKARSTSLLTSTALGTYRVDSSAGSTSTLPTVVAKPSDGSGPTIIAVHAVAPTPRNLTRWDADLHWLSTVCSGSDVIMAGDFNATLDHFAGLGSGADHALGSCEDAAALTKNAAVGTWPTFLPALFGAPIDHVMVGANWRVTGMRVVQNLDGAGSDHRPIVAQLQRAG